MLATRRHIGAMSRPSWAADSSALQSRTNQIRNNSGRGGIPGAPGTFPTNWIRVVNASATMDFVGTGIEAGIDYSDVRITGTGVSDTWSLTFEALTQIVAAETQTWSASFFAKLVGGSFANIAVRNRITFRDSGGAGVTTNDVVLAPTSAGLATQRSTQTFTAVGATIARVTSAFVTSTATGAFDFTIRIGLPMLHQGVASLSPIRTATAARDGVHSSMVGRV